MVERLRDKTPSERYADVERETEIGSTAGQDHDELLARTLGRERGLAAATCVHWQDPVVVGDEFEVSKPDVAIEGGTGRTAPKSPNEEFTEKKIERHGDVGGSA